MKLISCTDYVIEKTMITDKEVRECATTNILIGRFESHVKYANFLKRPLELGMFIPTDKEGNVLEKPTEKDYYTPKDLTQSWGDYLSKQYQEALDRVIFKGFDHNDKRGLLHTLDFDKGKIEDLTHLGLTLTDNAIKQLK